MREGYRHAPTRGNISRTDAGSCEALPLTRAAAEWARITRGARPHRATIARWCIKGVRGVRLRGELAGGQWVVTVAALREFHQRLNEPRPQAVDRSAGPARAAQIEQTLAELDALISTRPSS